MKNSKNSFIKYAFIFLIGVNAVYITSAYTNIDTSLTNAVQYIQKIMITSDGSANGTTGIILDGANGNIISNWFVSKGQTVSANGNYSTAMWSDTRKWKLFNSNGKRNICKWISIYLYGFIYSSKWGIFQRQCE